MSRVHMLLVAAMSVLFVPVLLAVTVAGGNKHPPNPPPVPTSHSQQTPTPSAQAPSGTIKSVDPATMSLVLTVGDGDKAKDVTLTANVKTVVNVDEKIAKFADLKAGMRALARVDANNAAINVMAKNQTLSGVIKSVEPKDQSLVLRIGWGDKANELTVKVNEKTVIKIDGQEAKLEDLKAGMKAAVRTDGSSVTAQAAPAEKK